MNSNDYYSMMNTLPPVCSIGADVETETEEKIDITEPGMFRVIVWNDDFTPMDFVVGLLVLLFEKSNDEATDIMLKIHHEGQATAGVYSEEIAEHKAYEGRLLAEKHGHPLQLTYEKVD